MNCSLDLLESGRVGSQGIVGAAASGDDGGRWGDKGTSYSVS